MAEATAPAVPATKKIKMSTSIAGPRMSAKPGDVVEFDAAEADRHVAFGNGTYHVEDDAPKAKK